MKRYIAIALRPIWILDIVITLPVPHFPSPTPHRETMLHSPQTPPNTVVTDPNIQTKVYDLGVGKGFEDVLAMLLERGIAGIHGSNPHTLVNVRTAGDDSHIRPSSPSTDKSWGQEGHIHDPFYHQEDYTDTCLPSTPTPIRWQPQTYTSSYYYQSLPSSPPADTPSTSSVSSQILWPEHYGDSWPDLDLIDTSEDEEDLRYSSFPVPPTNTANTSASTSTPNLVPQALPWDFSPCKFNPTKPLPALESESPPPSPASSPTSSSFSCMPLPLHPPRTATVPSRKPFFPLDAIRRYASADSLRRSSACADFDSASSSSSSSSSSASSSSSTAHASVKSIHYEDTFFGPMPTPILYVEASGRYKLKRRLEDRDGDAANGAEWKGGWRFPVRKRESGGEVEAEREEKCLPKKKRFLLPFSLFGGSGLAGKEGRGRAEAKEVMKQEGMSVKGEGRVKRHRGVAQFLTVPAVLLIQRRGEARERE
ncbi:hypothetical protein BS50DRAFT_381834 [Corynespora cassiicola Philippines]|uniref:Uncharacterized protein n=1 Tax=Corynespora cassiicola Philippines TaxID=1448308 RepID=A0A2T2NNT8_CORCC|nr:hypothetical protein BS50DRAFT_381834 [Corynespora cassiicola Philippines]